MTTKQVVTKGDLGNTLKLDTKNKKIQVNTGSGISVSPEGVLSVESGLSADSIGNLPVKYWEKGTTVLAKQDDELVRIRSLSDLFQDVGVGVNAAKYRFEINKDNKVTLTVTNSGNNTAENIVLTTVIPEGITIKDERVRTGGTEYTKNSTLSYNINNLLSKRTFVVEFNVLSDKSGQSYKFDFQATVDGVETNARNNKVSMILESYDPAPPVSNYVPTADCPLIKAYYLDGSKQQELVTYSDLWKIPTPEKGRYLNVVNTGDGLEGKKIKLQGASTVVAVSGLITDKTNITIINSGYLMDANYTNIHISTTNSRESASNSYVYLGSTTAVSTNTFSTSEKLLVGDVKNMLVQYLDTNGNVAYNRTTNEYDSTSSAVPGNDSGSSIIDAGVFDPDTGIFTFHNDFKVKNPSKPGARDTAVIRERLITLWMRPQGDNCRWQCVTLIPTFHKPELFTVQDKKVFDNIRVVKGKATLNINKDLYPEERRWSKGPIVPNRYFFTDQALWVGKSKPSDLDVFLGKISEVGSFVYEWNQARLNNSFTVTAKKGQEVVVEFDYYGGKDTKQTLPSRYSVEGNTSISKHPTDSTKGVITISPNATTTDSISLGDIRVVVTD